MMRQSFRPTLLWAIGLLLLTISSVNAVEPVRVSDFGNGVQLWFEAEAYDERNPDDETSFALSDEAGAFGRSITSLVSSTVSRSGDVNGNIRYDFNLKDAEGAGGTWYFWGRVINPRSNSDALLVDGHPGDPTPVTSPDPPPGLGLQANYSHVRIFEQAGPDEWFWAPGSAEAGEEGHAKQLRDGENTMWIVSKEGGAIWDVLMWTNDPDYVPTDEDYQLATAPVRGRATFPIPANDATDVTMFIDELNWNAGEFAATHDVYFGTDLAAVEAGAASVLVSQGQIETSLAITPEMGTTYYWRVDAVNGGVIPGKVWNFTIEPVGRPIPAQSIVVTSSSVAENPILTIDGTGLVNGQHSDDGATMWTSDGERDVWLQYEFDRAYPLHEMLVWNHNTGLESLLGLGAKDVVVSYSADGQSWVVLESTTQFARATGLPTYKANTTVAFGEMLVQAVRIEIINNWSGVFPSTGLSEVQFLTIPLSAILPTPESGTSDVAVDAMLSWRAGRGATQHTVYVSSDEQSVAEGTAPAVTVDQTHHSPALDLATTYYWSVDAIHEGRDPAVWTSDIWSFSTQEMIVLDDFESYSNFSPNRPFQTWLDGIGYSADDFIAEDFGGNGSGAAIGHDIWTADGEHFGGSIMEADIKHGGSQSMPLYFDNAFGGFSEANRTLSPAQDWTQHGITTLIVHFHGAPDNTGQLYVKIGNTKITYPGDAADLATEAWTVWEINLSASGASLSSVSSLSIGVDGGNAFGLVYIDDVLLK